MTPASAVLFLFALTLASLLALRVTLAWRARAEKLAHRPTATATRGVGGEALCRHLLTAPQR